MDLKQRLSKVVEINSTMINMDSSVIIVTKSAFDILILTLQEYHENFLTYLFDCIKNIINAYSEKVLISYSYE